MSQDAWLLSRGRWAAPVEELDKLFEEHGGLDLRAVRIVEVPGAGAGFALCEFDDGAIALSGRLTTEHLALLELACPEGGLLVHGDGELQEIEAAQDPTPLLAIYAAALDDDAAEIERLLPTVRRIDRRRLPWAAISRLVCTSRRPRLGAQAIDLLEVFYPSEALLSSLRALSAQLPLASAMIRGYLN